MNKIAGIDYSLTSPAICVWKRTDDDRLFDFDSCDVYYLENTSRSTAHGILNIHGEPYPEWNSEEERHDKLSDWTMSIIKGCDNIFIEGYAFATSGKSHVRSVAENTGLLKHKMYKVKLKYTSVPPSVIKKYATGKGNANKELMYAAFNAELVTPPDLQLRFKPKSKKLSNPVTDIVDSYFIAKWGWEGFAS
tara:strand:- start:729 stop:1304 length:576 start_codon:yes stop_codon:yes gene_type:complete